jgi:hypothetical protein
MDPRPVRVPLRYHGPQLVSGHIFGVSKVSVAGPGRSVKTARGARLLGLEGLVSRSAVLVEAPPAGGAWSRLALFQFSSFQAAASRIVRSSISGLIV